MSGILRSPGPCCSSCPFSERQIPCGRDPGSSVMECQRSPVSVPEGLTLSASSQCPTQRHCASRAAQRPAWWSCHPVIPPLMLVFWAALSRSSVSFTPRPPLPGRSPLYTIGDRPGPSTDQPAGPSAQKNISQCPRKGTQPPSGTLCWASPSDPGLCLDSASVVQLEMTTLQSSRASRS